MLAFLNPNNDWLPSDIGVVAYSVGVFFKYPASIFCKPNIEIPPPGSILIPSNAKLCLLVYSGLSL